MTEANDNFLGLPHVDLQDIRPDTIAVIGASEASPYKAGIPSHSAEAPAVLRAVSRTIARSLRQFDFDLGMALLPEPAVSQHG